MAEIRVGIVGYGNIGRGVELAVARARDMKPTAIFTRRNPAGLRVESGAPVYLINDAAKMVGEIDVMILCGGSAQDLPEQAPALAALFNIVDSFDTHAKIPEYLALVNAAAVNTTAVISTGWDPGLFSVIRMMSGAFLPNGVDYTFWGNGVSQGHSDAVRKIDGIKKGADGKKMAVQYTVPNEQAVAAVRGGQTPNFSVKDKHLRECYVVAEDGANLAAIEHEIKTMPHYFADYNTAVTFISTDEFLANHTKMPHGGFVFRSGTTGEHKQIIELSLKLQSNPEFTASVMTAYARAAVRMANEGNFGAKTVFDVPPVYLSQRGRDELIKELL